MAHWNWSVMQTPSRGSREGMSRVQIRFCVWVSHRDAQLESSFKTWILVSSLCLFCTNWDWASFSSTARNLMMFIGGRNDSNCATHLQKSDWEQQSSIVSSSCVFQACSYQNPFCASSPPCFLSLPTKNQLNVWKRSIRLHIQGRNTSYAHKYSVKWPSVSLAWIEIHIIVVFLKLLYDDRGHITSTQTVIFP